MEDSARPGRVVCFGLFELDLRTAELRKNGLRLKLQGQPFQVLVALLENPGQVVTREELRQKLWPIDTFVDFDHSLGNAINKIREALGDSTDSPRFVETLPRRGYRFIAPVNRVDGRNVEAGPVGAQRGRPQQVPLPEPRAKKTGLRYTVTIVGGTVGLLGILLVGLMVGPWHHRVLNLFSPSHIESLAVLPLENLSHDPEQEYFAEGMTDELITALAKIGPLRVISRTSVMQYKATHKPLGQIARELNVDAVVEGTVVRSGNHVRITARLIRAATEMDLWAETYERDLSAMLTLQGEVAQAIADAIQVKLAPRELARLASARPVNRDAYDAYLKGRYFWNRRTEETLNKAVEYFQQAVNEDPNYAPAYAGLADSYGLFGFALYGALPRREAELRAETAAVKAVEIDDTLAEAHNSLAVIQFNSKWDWAYAEKEFKRAIQLNPNYATAYQFYALYLASMRRQEEATITVKRALELDPLSLTINAAVGRHLYWARQYEQAIEQLRNALELDPRFAVAHFRLGQVYVQKGMNEQAVAEFTAARDLSGDGPLYLAGLAHAYAVSGKGGKAHGLLDELKALGKSHYVSPYDMAIIYLGLGEKDQTLAWLEKAYEEREGSLVYLNVEQTFDPIRSDPRFVQLMRRIGLPP